MVKYSVFSKPWHMPLDELGQYIAELGFDGVEFPVRPGYPVTPENMGDLPQTAKTLGKYGLKIYSVAGPMDEATITACAEAGVPIIRVMARIPLGVSYLDAVADFQRQYDALVPLLGKHGVTIGVQNHCGRFVSNAAGLRLLLAKYDPRHIAAVWDAAHEALEGNEPDLALDIIWDRLCMVNLKNSFWRRATGPEAEYAQWKNYWTGGRQGLASWPKVVDELKSRGYDGVVCLTAEYSDHESVDRLIKQDLAFAKSLFEA